MPVYDIVRTRPNMNARIWWNEFPSEYELHTDGQFTEVVADASEGCTWGACRAAVALDYISGMPRFGLLGGRFTPTTSGQFVLRLPQSPLDVQWWEAAPGRKLGLPGEYGPAVGTGVLGREGEWLDVPSGVLTLHVAAHDEVYSAPVVFVRVARALRSVMSLSSELDAETLDRFQF
ncbi:hypothetical protein [Deinococcus pimensis]|uniref:hypothetical protein n=1 Tax=Deinococcus pimensis TaxID=309888 RepID=UPI0012F725DD|nr:hypothetical protein [Deinococcus pimensis]